MLIKALIIGIAFIEFSCCNKNNENKISCLNFYNKTYDIIIYEDEFWDDSNMDIGIKCDPHRYLQNTIPCINPTMDKIRKEFYKINETIRRGNKLSYKENSDNIACALQKELPKIGDLTKDRIPIFVSSFKCNICFQSQEQRREYNGIIYIKYKYKGYRTTYSSIFVDGEIITWDD